MRNKIVNASVLGLSKGLESADDVVGVGENVSRNNKDSLKNPKFLLKTEQKWEERNWYR